MILYCTFAPGQSRIREDRTLYSVQKVAPINRDEDDANPAPPRSCSSAQSFFGPSPPSDLEAAANHAEGLITKAKALCGPNVGRAGIGFGAGCIAGFACKKCRTSSSVRPYWLAALPVALASRAGSRPEELKEKAEDALGTAQGIAAKNAQGHGGVCKAGQGQRWQGRFFGLEDRALKVLQKAQRFERRPRRWPSFRLQAGMNDCSQLKAWQSTEKPSWRQQLAHQKAALRSLLGVSNWLIRRRLPSGSSSQRCRDTLEIQLLRLSNEECP